MKNTMISLRPYQTEIAFKGSAMLSESGIIYLSMQTRTGKTITAFEICRLQKAVSVLFVTKKKAISSIEKDYLNYADHFKCTVINYESVSKVQQSGYDIAIIDEAHGLGAYPKPSKRYKDLKRITEHLPVILMSATPSPESYSQLFHQFTINRFHSWSKAKNFYQWAKYYVNKKTKYLYNREVPDYSEAKEDLVRKATDKYFISFSQTDAGIEQQIKEVILTVDMQPITDKMIKRLQRDKVIEMDEGVILADTAVKLMSKHHQMSSGSVKFEDGTVKVIDTSKGEFIRDYFKDQKIAVFYKFIGELQILTSVFDKWTADPDEFQGSNDTVFLGQFLSAREGVRLDSADAIVFFNLDFSYLSYEQSKNRIVSKERTKEAVLYWIFNRMGIEPKIYKAVTAKKDYTLNYYKHDFRS